MRLVQFVSATGRRRVGRVSQDDRMVEALSGFASAYELARSAARRGTRLEALFGDAAVDERVELADLLADGRLLAPIDHPDSAHCLVTGTGLTHLGSAQARDAMHEVTKQDESKLSDSMRMFRLGLEGGRTNGTVPGVAPEWFYKGDGSIVVSPGQPLSSPSFALDGGEEAEIAAIYLIDDAGRPCRLGYALGNEFSDHVLERQNYLYLAHSKLRPCSFGPELLIGDLPDHVQGKVNMSHALANLEHHHFKYPLFRRPGDIHVHFLGAAVLSHSAGVKTVPDDVFEIRSATFGAPLRNPLAIGDDEGMVRVRAL